MIVFTTEDVEGACVAHLGGTFDPDDDPAGLTEDLAEASGDNPLIIDLTGVEPPTGPSMTVLLRTLARGPAHGTTVVVHPDLETRRVLRARAHGLPVVPSNELVLRGRFASALIAHDKPEVC